MKNHFAVFMVILFSFSLSAQESTIRKLYVGTYTSEGAEGIYLCRFDESSGSLSLENIFNGIEDPTFLKISPDRKYLYAVTRASNNTDASGGYIQAFEIKPDGSLTFINRQSSNGAGPCHVDVSPDGRFAAIATYGGGTFSLYPVQNNGSVGEASMTIQSQGSGSNPDRQKGPHAHSVIFTPDGKMLFGADLGTDRMHAFDIKGDKIISASQSYLHLAPGSGPRHFKFHPDAKTMYVINELNSTITSFKKKGRKWKELQTITTLPENFSGTNYCADIHVSPDGRFLYGSNRGHNSIAVYSINQKSKMLGWVTSVSTHGDWPRNFTLSADGKFLLAANQRSGNIVVFKIDPATGIPEYTGNELQLPSPVCLEFL